ncbi:MAG: alpha/beta hydrolase [Betaproteobacteria bacterium SG8_39]|nr:MAG: alpha/beta hydrolase [Betaproteobacteria bacterium SG8_39]
MSVHSSYRAPWWLPGGHLQTIVAALRPPPRPAMTRERWDTPDGDFIDVDFAGPAQAARTLVVFHGLEGSADSSYARGLARAAAAAGWRVALPHFRGCSGEPNRLGRAYHSGDSEELDWILRRLAANAGPLLAAGVSLGGNVLLKWLGEQGRAASSRVSRAAAVSAPLDLQAAGDALDRGLNRLLYTRLFLSSMKASARAKVAAHALPVDAARVQAARTLREFDDAYTAPLHGFRDVNDYWTRASSAPWLAQIRVPTLVLNARNDPFLPAAALATATHAASAAVLLESPDTGGHVGFLEGPFPGRHGWLARRVLDFLSQDT